ncbi:pirin family protein [Roseobacter sp. HKCCD9010]|uniref:pirin family protein n=1 Tax=unclassified Roseobacter TaxID=196798 RepID=UPI0014924405|nr:MULTISPECIES: pirin family protein [unclassified Roseobacter]MBF9050602.1 pirin family protein [Rhodobacterales bacterium HKCCD4356]NNV11979.1 pirin family protein [Roseobacter sp. HKCCD7357]NNV16992.1 pirin family protein [Roseobacter sp. HKCCD8768]NNV26222.1 pirin family protein [Roseobacter sp. HKCCD8192]NNV30717.1 pirin family protein [Roseobacter sp. HKCCD9061]
MSWNPALDPDCPTEDAVDAIETVIVPRARDLGDFEVRRALPAPKRQMVGPFIFFDQMGPAEFVTGKGVDIRPHPHIGLATVTYLYKGKFHHRDSLGTDQWIEPGAVNLMTAAHGITHSERIDGEMLKAPYNLFGIQTWIALPKGAEDGQAAFVHAGKSELPLLEGEGKEMRLILGNAYGERAPVETASEMFYADALLQPGARLPMPDDHEDRGAYVVSGRVEIAGQRYEAGQMMVFRPGDRVSMTAGEEGARVMILGGETLEGPRYIWWNFVASSKERIEEAKEAWRAGDWEHGRFQLPPTDKEEFIPLPER